MRRIRALPLFFCASALAQDPPAPDAQKAEAQLHIDQAEALFREGKFAEARRKFQRANDLISGTADPAALLRLSGRIAECWAGEGDFANAAREWRLGGEHLAVADGLAGLAKTLHSAGRAKDALPLFEESLELRRRLVPGDDASIAADLNDLAACLFSLGRADLALASFGDFVAMHRRLHADDSAMVATALSHMAACLTHLGRAAEALPLAQESIAIRRRLGDKDSADAVAGLNALAQCLRSSGRGSEALQILEQALAMQRRLHEGDHLDVASSLNRLGFCLAGLGRATEALPYYEDALAMRRRVIREDHPDLAGSLNNVGYCLQILGRPAEALRHYEESLAMRRRLFPGDHPDVATAISGVARCHLALGSPSDALPLLQEALAMSRRIAGDDRGVANALGNLASCLEDLGSARDALPLREESLAILRRTCAGDDPDLATAVGNLGYCLMTLGCTAEALPCFEEEKEMRRRSFPRDHPGAAANHYNMASCLSKLGRESEARILYEESLAMTRRLFEGDHPDVATGLDGLGGCMRKLGAFADARPLLEEALAMRRRLFGDDHPDVATSLNNLGLALHDAGRPHQALPLLEESLAITRRVRPRDHVDVARSLNNVGLCLASLGRPAEALLLHEEALAMIRRLGCGDLRMLASMLGNVATTTLDVGRAADALPFFEDSLATSRQMVKGDHQDLALSLNNLALCLLDLGRTADALLNFQESLAMSQRLFEGDHPLVTSALSNVGTCLNRLGRGKDAVPFLEDALAMSRRLCGGEDARVARQEMNLAMALIGAGRSDEGWRHAEEAIQVGRRVDSPDLHAALANAATIRLEAGEAAAALALAEEAVDRVEVLRAGAEGLTEADRASYFAQLKRFGAFDLGVAALRALGRDEEAIRFVECARARSLLDMLDRARIDALSEARRRAAERGDAALLERIDAAQAALEGADAEVARLTHSLATGPTASDAAEAREEVKKRTAELATARRMQQEALRHRAQQIRGELAATRPADAAGLQRLVGHDGRLLLYSVSEEGSTVFHIPPQGSRVRAFSLTWRDGSAVTAASLEARVEAYASRMRAGKGEARGWFEEEAGAGGGVSGSELFEALVPAEVREDILKAKVVYVVADGALNRLPFETLVVAPGTFWLEGGPPLVYGASGSALLWSRERRDQQLSEGRLDGAVVVGDPVFRPALEPPATGILVTGVALDGQAARLGMQAGDVVLAYDGKEIADIKALTEARAAAAIKEGSRKPGGITLVVWRAGERKEVSVEAGPLGVMIAPGAPPEAWRRFHLGDPALARAALERTADLSRYGELRPLPGTRKEAEAIGAALKDLRVTLLLGESATHPAVLAAAPGARYLHFATHGLADETEMASYSSLALTLPAVPTAEDDGFLSLEDLFSRWRGKLQGCELVVLSACETQKGRIQKDEAVQALPVGFLFAGAPTVIASLWRVDDASAAELMGDFYRRLAAGKGKLEAFTEARKALRKRHPEPYHWAPFVYIGDPR